MFVQNLNPEQQFALLKTAETLISCDGEVTEQEIEYLDFLRSQMDGLTEGDFEVASLKDLFSTQKSKVSFLLELIAIAHTDNEYHANEANLITEVANLLEVNANLLGELEDWVVKQTTLLSQAEELME
jgi:uncharacterized tellurite resistance protein B-like protein